LDLLIDGKKMELMEHYKILFIKKLNLSMIPSVKVLFGEICLKVKFPVSISKKYPFVYGL